VRFLELSGTYTDANPQGNRAQSFISYKSKVLGPICSVAKILFSERFRKIPKKSQINSRISSKTRDFSSLACLVQVRFLPRSCIGIMADFTFSCINFDNDSADLDFIDVYNYVTENDVNESCLESPIRYPETLCPFPWEPTVAFAPGKFDVNVNNLEGIMIVPPSYRPYPSASVEMAPTSTGKSIDLGQNPRYEGPRHKKGCGPANYFIRTIWSDSLDKDLSLLKSQWALPDGYSLVKPRRKDSILDVPEGCIAIYKDAMDTGLRFPLHPFAVELLNAYNITVSELYPNGWGCIVAFLIICSAVGVEPTLTAFRYIFRIRRCTSKQGPGWVSFQHRTGFLIVHKLKDSMKKFRNDFVFLYRAEPWPFKTSHDEQPNLQLNNNVPQCNLDEFLVIEHATKGLELGEFKPQFVQRNFVIDRTHLQNELFLSALGISQKYHRGE
jgi:putative gypsy type transposon